MRWPWQPPPGMVRVKDKELIGLLRNALRAVELEAEVRQVEAEATHAEATARAAQLLHERDPGCELDRDRLLAELPTTRDGRLHEAAFLALVDQEQLWTQRERLVEQWAGAAPEEK